MFAQPQTWLWDGAQLVRAKHLADNGDPVIKDARDRLLADAGKWLLQPDPSVTDKGVTPPSGDKHDYISMGRYWWPDPSKPDGLPYIRKDGYSNPELSKYDRERLGALGNGVTTLTLAWYFSGRDEFARKAASMIDTWFVNPKTRMNPHMNYGQIVPGRNNNMGRGEGLLDGYSFVGVVDAFIVLEESGFLSKKQRACVRKWFSDYVGWMTSSPIAKDEDEAKNNHAVAFDVQLAVYAAFTGNDPIAARVAGDFATRRLFTQIEPDGRQPLELARTTAFGYSVFNLGHMIDMCFMARKLGVDLMAATGSDGRSIAGAINYLAGFLGKPASEFPYKQIRDWDKVQQSLVKEIFRAYVVSGDESYLTTFERYRPAILPPEFTLLYMR